MPTPAVRRAGSVSVDPLPRRPTRPAIRPCAGQAGGRVPRTSAAGASNAGVGKDNGRRVLRRPFGWAGDRDGARRRRSVQAAGVGQDVTAVTAGDAGRGALLEEQAPLAERGAAQGDVADPKQYIRYRAERYSASMGRRDLGLA